MNKAKKIIIAFGIALVIYGLFTYIYNTYIKEPYQSIYVLKKDIAKNEAIKAEDIEEIKIINFGSSKKYISKNDVIKEKGNIVSAYTLRVGQILTSDVILKKDKIVLNKEEGLEYISLDIKSSGAAVSYEVKKGSIVNIYYSAKSKTVDSVITSKEKIYSSNNPDGTVTCKLLENIEIINVYNSKTSSSIGVSEDIKVSDVFDTIVIRVSQKDAMAISNLKQTGEFNLTIVG